MKTPTILAAIMMLLPSGCNATDDGIRHMKVVSWNILSAGSNGGFNGYWPPAWSARKHALIKVLTDSDADVIGLQEVQVKYGTYNQRGDLITALKSRYSYCQGERHRNGASSVLNMTFVKREHKHKCLGSVKLPSWREVAVSEINGVKTVNAHLRVSVPADPWATVAIFDKGEPFLLLGDIGGLPWNDDAQAAYDSLGGHQEEYPSVDHIISSTRSWGAEYIPYPTLSDHGIISTNMWPNPAVRALPMPLKLILTEDTQ